MTALPKDRLPTTLRYHIARLLVRFRCRFGLAARHLDTGEELALNADSVFPTASVIKLAVLVELFRQAENGALPLERPIEVRAGDRMGGSGVLRELAPGLRLTVRDLATLMIIVSDNMATKILLDTIGGVEAVNYTMQHRLQLRNIALNGYDKVKLGEATPRDLIKLLATLATGKMWSQSASQEMLTILSRNIYLDQFPRYLKHNRYIAGGGVSVACKTGFDKGTRADAGVITLPDDSRFVYAVVSDGFEDPIMSIDSDGSILNGLVGRLVVQHWWASKPNDVLIPIRPRASSRVASRRGARRKLSSDTGFE